MGVTDIGVNKPFKNISANRACLVASKRNDKKIGNDNCKWKKSADAFDNVSELLLTEIQFFCKKDYHQR